MKKTNGAEPRGLAELTGWQNVGCVGSVAGKDDEKDGSLC